MTTQEKTDRRNAGRLRITQEDVVRIVGRKMKAKGLEAAEELFETLNNNFSTERGWPETAGAVYAMFDEERSRLQEEQQALRRREHAEELEVARAGAPLILQNNSNTASAVRNQRNDCKVDQWNNMIEGGAQVGYNNQGGHD